jgi:uncharacterized membrane protein YhfC
VTDLPILLIIMFILAGMFNVLFPILLGWWIIRKHKTSWKLFGVGVLTFVGSQIFHLPVVSGLTAAFQSGALPHVNPAFAPYFNAIVLGLLAGLFEETARWVGYKLLKKQGDSFGASITLGAGHGGVEAIAVGFVVLFTLVSMISLRAMDAGSLPLPADQLALAQQQVAAYFATPWHLPLAGAVERVGAVALHITLSIMVWLSFSKRKALWFWGAVLYHAVVDGLTVLAVSFGMGTWLLEALFILVAFGGLYLVWQAGKKAEADRIAMESKTEAIVEAVQTR